MNLDLSRDEQIIAALRRIVRAIDLQSRHLVDRHGITGPQLVTLRANARLGTVPVSFLARQVHLSHPTVTGILDRLEQRGWVVRGRDSRDRRRVAVSVTPEGRRLLMEMPSPLQDRFRDRLQRLAEWEHTMILATLQRVASLMDAESLEASPFLTTDAMGAPAAAPARAGEVGGDAIAPAAARTERGPAS